jgi:hypothetical protein
VSDSKEDTPSRESALRDGATRAAADRENRYSSHALVELRRFRLLPFGVNSAVLLDISAGGFKAEFTGEAKVKPGDQFWLSIPLTPLGITAPGRLLCRGECRWFDGKRFRIGGVFLALSKNERLVMDQIISTLRARGAINI